MHERPRLRARARALLLPLKIVCIMVATTKALGPGEARAGAGATPGTTGGVHGCVLDFNWRHPAGLMDTQAKLNNLFRLANSHGCGLLSPPTHIMLDRTHVHSAQAIGARPPASSVREAGGWADMYTLAPNFWQDALPAGAVVVESRTVTGRPPTMAEMTWLSNRTTTRPPGAPRAPVTPLALESGAAGANASKSSGATTRAQARAKLAPPIPTWLGANLTLDLIRVECPANDFWAKHGSDWRRLLDTALPPGAPTARFWLGPSKRVADVVAQSLKHIPERFLCLRVRRSDRLKQHVNVYPFFS